MQQAMINYILIKNVRLEKHDQKACGAIVLVPHLSGEGGVGGG